MKSILCLTVCALSILAFASTAQSGAEADGKFDFALAGATGAIDFAGGINNAGTVKGQMSFAATVQVDDGDGGTVGLDFTIGLNFDCMLANGNRAAMSGVITSASPSASALIGQQALLAVEDQVPGVSPTTDAFVWGVYQPIFVNLTAADYDLCPQSDPLEQNEQTEDFPSCAADPGTTLTWAAKDLELCPDFSNADPSALPDPFPVSICGPDPGQFTAGISTLPTEVDCETFPLSAYPLNLIPNGGGNKVVVKVGT